jgi:hypothetical protein
MREKFIRFYEMKLDDKLENGDYSTIDDKKFGFAVYDEDFKYVDDYIVGNIGQYRPFYKTMISTPDGLLFFSANRNDKIYLTKIKYE